MAGALVGDEGDVAGLAGFEADGGAGGDVQALAAGGGAVEAQGGVGFGEVVVGADLDRAVAGVGDGEGGAGRPALSSISPGWVWISPGIMGVPIGFAGGRGRCR